MFKRGRRMGGYGEFVNGIDRVDNSLGYVADNCVPCCEACNRAKLQMSSTDFINLANRIVTHQNRHKEYSQNPISPSFWAQMECEYVC